MRRREFLLGTLGMGLLAKACKDSGIPLKFESPSPSAHKLREEKHGPIISSRDCSILVVGSGISGLSFMRSMAGSEQQIIWIESESKIGGNSSWSSNAIGNYPLGAHYLPIPDERDTELLNFLEEAGSIISWENGLPVYNDYHLCQDPEERLFIDGYWQEGLVPSFGINESDRKEIKSFFEQVNIFKQKKGADAKDWFCIPIEKCSNDPEARKLDQLSFDEDLRIRGFQSKALLAYLDYCCKDDYGSSPKQLSAWAGWHYFAGRKGKGFNAGSGDVLTWPEGNGYLAKSLLNQCKQKPETCVVALSIQQKDQKQEVLTWNSHTQTYETITCTKLVLATPQFVNKKLLPSHKEAFRNWDYMPWLIANLSMKSVPETKGMPLSWDNVWLGKKSLGYVNAGHQLLNPYEQKTILTLYFPLTGENTKEIRKQARTKSPQDWKKWIEEEMNYAHPSWENYCTEISLQLWGHAMPRPIPGFLQDKALVHRKELEEKGIYLAHSDLSGLSLFEEAFHAGLKVANQLKMEDCHG